MQGGVGLRVWRRKGQLTATIGLALLLGWAVAAADAAGGYGPLTPPALPGGPAAFEGKVQVVKTLGRSGGRLSAALKHSARVTVTVPPRAFSKSVQIAIAAPSLSDLKSVLDRLHDPSSTVATGFALLIEDSSGKAVTQRSAKPITIVIRGPGLGTKNERVLSVTSGTAASALDVKRAPAEVSFSVRKEADLLVINRSSPGV